MQTRHGTNLANHQANLEIPVLTQTDLNKAVYAAKTVFKKWSLTTIEECRAALGAFSNAIAFNKDGLAKLLTMEQGKPLSQAYQEIDMTSTWLRAIPAQDIPEDVIEDTEDRKIVHHHVPMRVAGGIVPWNYPILLACSKITPALYTRNTIIIKPSPFTPYCDLKLGELGTKIFPPGILQVLSDGNDLGLMMTAHLGVDNISFMGPSMTRKKVMASCGATPKQVTLELGGNDPAIICDDIDIDALVPKMMVLCFLCSSQICMMVKRLYIHENIYDKFLDAFVKHTQTLKSGEGNEPDVFFGPVQNGMQYEKVKDLFAIIPRDGLHMLIFHVFHSIM